MTLGSHQRTVGASQSHFTPRWIIDRLGPFDTDPCAGHPRPWSCARVNFTEADDGLSREWQGIVWLNPPFNRYQVGRWIERLAQHNNGVALLHARTEAAWFEPVWRSAAGILFMADRIHFYRPDGSRQPANSGAPPLIVAFGAEALDRLKASGIEGALVERWIWQNELSARPHAAPPIDPGEMPDIPISSEGARHHQSFEGNK
jgi:hypothetical protein